MLTHGLHALQITCYMPANFFIPQQCGSYRIHVTPEKNKLWMSLMEGKSSGEGNKMQAKIDRFKMLASGTHSIAASQHQQPRFEPELRLLVVWSFSSVLLQVLLFPLIS